MGDKRFDSPAKRLSVYEHTKRSFAHPVVESKRKECGNAMSFLNKMKNNKDPRRKSPVTSTRRLERRRGVDEVDVFDSRVIEKEKRVTNPPLKRIEEVSVFNPGAEMVSRRMDAPQRRTPQTADFGMQANETMNAEVQTSLLTPTGGEVFKQSRREPRMQSMSGFDTPTQRFNAPSASFSTPPQRFNAPTQRFKTPTAVPVGEALKHNPFQSNIAPPLPKFSNGREFETKGHMSNLRVRMEYIWWTPAKDSNKDIIHLNEQLKQLTGLKCSRTIPLATVDRMVTNRNVVALQVIFKEGIVEDAAYKKFCHDYKVRNVAGIMPLPGGEKMYIIPVAILINMASIDAELFAKIVDILEKTPDLRFLVGLWLPP